jgi:cation diffusion facilitator family transporter
MNETHTSKAILTAFIGNLSIALAKLIGFLFTASSAMLSEAVHSFADSANQILLFVGNKRALIRGNHKFNFGYGKEEFILSFMVAIVLFMFGAIFSIYEGIHQILHPQQIRNVGWVLAILVFAIAVEGYSLLQAYKAKKSKDGFFKYLRKTSDSATVVVIIEDTAALLGLGFSFIFILLAYLINPVFDGIGAVTTGVILGLLALLLAFELYKLLAGESLSAAETYKLRQLISKNCTNIEQINFIKSMIIGNNKYLIIVSIDPFDSDSGQDVQDLSQKIKHLIGKQYPSSEVFVDFSELQEINSRA